MLDRASTFAHPEIVDLLKTRFIPVAIDQAYQRRQKDAEGKFYRKIAGQSPRNNFRSTTQGFYAATNEGKLLFYNNNRNPDRLAGLMKKALQDNASRSQNADPIEDATSPDRRYNPQLPEGGLIVRVHAKVLDGYETPENQWQKIFQESLSRDNLWITGSEHDSLVNGNIPETLQRRIARFHLVDNTRGEPPMWDPEAIESLEMNLEKGVITGSATLKALDANREFQTGIYGLIETREGKVTRFDMVASGNFRGHGRYTKNPPAGFFPLAISFTLADGSDVADAIPPQGSRGWLESYLQ